MEYTKREIIIALIASGLVISLCFVLAGAGYWYLAGRDAEGPGVTAGGVSDPSNEQTQEETDENQRGDSGNGNSTNAVVGGGFQDSYLFTNPMESLTCVGAIVLMLVSLIGIDYYMRRRRRRQKST